MKRITLERLKELVEYNSELGRFFWLQSRHNSMKKGTEAGSFDAHGYGQIVLDRKIYKEHHIVWFYHTGEWPDQQIDHINHQRRDNRFENLRLADNSENHKNRPMQRNNTSGFVGVYWDKRGWFESYIHIHRRKIRLGRFAEIEDAIEARKRANKEYGFHENHGVGNGITQRPEARRLERRIEAKQEAA
jgi:hypothetical protein